MKFESEKLSARASDGLSYAAVLSEVNRVLYENFVNYLPFLDEINGYNSSTKFENFIKNQSLEILNERSIPEKILDIYTRNIKFFNKKYSFTEKDLDKLSTVSEKGTFILEKIFDDLQILKDVKNGDFFKKTVFGINDINIVECPIIVQNKYNSLPFDIDKNGKIVSDFFFLNNGFYIECPDNGKQILIDSNKGNRYFFEKDYFEKTVLDKNLSGVGFHFEKFICFDFDETKFLSTDKNILSQESDSQINLEMFFYSCLNSAFFLSEKNQTKDIIINPSYLNKIFSNGISDQRGKTQYQLILEKYLLNFVTNVRYGLRLVARQEDMFDKEQIYIKEEKAVKDFRLTKTFNLSKSPSLFRKPSSFISEPSNPKQVKKSFSSLEYSIIKNKSFILHNEITKGDKKEIHRRTWFPIVSVFHSLDKQRNEPLEMSDLHRFSDETIEILKDKIINTKEFNFVLRKIIPLDSLFILQKMDTATAFQDILNFSLSQPDNEKTIIAKSLQSTLLTTVDIMLKDQKEY